MLQLSKKTIGGMVAEQLQEETEAALFKRFLPNMDKFVIDHEYGGFMCDIEIDTCKHRSTTKLAWFEGRGIWLYSFLYNNFNPDPKYLKIAKQSIDFILRHQPEGDGFWPASYTREGKPTSPPGDIYGNLFIAEGLMEYSRATKQHEYWLQAKKIIMSALGRYDQPDYQYSIRFGLQNIAEVPAPRVLGHWMIFLRLASQFLEHDDDKDIKQLADRCIEAIMQYHLNPEFNLLNECINHDLSIPDNDWGQFAYLGHGCEALWMIMAEALRRNNSILFEKAAEAFKRHVTVATDPVAGGYFTSLDNVRNYQFQLDKVLWLQEEILNGTMLLIARTDDDWAHNCFRHTYQYIQEKFTYPEFAFVVENGDRMMLDPIRVRAEHYHHPRRLMLTLLAIKRMRESA